MATKKRPAKKAAAKKAPRKQSLRSFKVASAQTPFLTFRITQQTLYWGIISVLVLALGMWVIYLQIKINEIYDIVDANTYQLNLVPDTVKEPKKAN